MNKELLPFESESLSRKELNALIAVTEENGHIRKKHRPVLPVAAAVAAVAAVSSVGVYAAVYNGISRKESVNNYYDSEIVNEIIDNDFSELIENNVSENEHFRITIESVLSDDMTVNLVATIDALDEEGKSYLNKDKDNAYELGFLPVAYAYDKNGKFIAFMDSGYSWGYGTVETDTTKSFVIEVEKDRLDGTEEIFVKLYETFYFEETAPAENIYTGIEFKVKTKANLETFTFVNENGYEIRMSPYRFYKIGTIPVAEEDEPFSFVIHYNNGSSEEGVIAQFGYAKFDVKNIESIEYGKYTFYPKK